MAGILYVLRTGCQWNALPSSKYGSGKTAHRYFQRWIKAGVFRKMWQAGLNEYDEIKGIDWKWQALDGSMTKAPLGGQNTGPNPTDRAKRGTKRSMLVDKDGVPLAVVVAGANKPDGKLLEATLDAVQIEVSAVAVEQHLCLDKGYTAKHCLATGEEHGYTVHVPDKTNAKKTKATARAT
jgi:putative transposase